MAVVSDASPFNYIVRIGHVELLPRLFQRVWIPGQVAAELSQPSTPREVVEVLAAPPPWLSIAAPRRVDPMPEIHAGEAAAIALALEARVEVILIDERDGRRAAAKRGLVVIGTLGVLELATARDWIDLAAAIGKLRSTDFRARPSFFDEAIAADLARRSRRRE